MGTNGTSRNESERMQFMKHSFDHSKALKVMTKLREQIFAYYEGNRTIPLDLCRDATNLHAYYLYAVLDATKETAPTLVNLLMALGQQTVQQEDRFHDGFFAALAELLKVKFEMERLGKKIKRQDFERSFSETKRKYGLGEARKSVQNDELIRKAQLTGYVVREMTYHSPLPSELEQAYCYTVDGGHSIIVVLEKEYREGQRVEDNLVPAPVRTVLRHGYKIKDGYVWCNIPYSKELGLLTAEEDDEF
jgi:hypothetical protein